MNVPLLSNPRFAGGAILTQNKRMAGRLQRLITRVESSAAFGEYVWRALQALWVIGVGGMTGWAAAASDWLNAYGPISWITAGLLGALVVCVCLALGGIFKDRMARARVWSIMSSTPKSINPLDNIFTNQRIDLNDFHSPFYEPAIGKTFVDCELLGPCVLAFVGTSINGLTAIECDFVKVDENASVKTAVVFVNANIKRCKIYRATVLMGQTDVRNFESVAGKVAWINP